MSNIQLCTIIESKYFSVAEMTYDDSKECIIDSSCYISPSEELIEHIKEKRLVGNHTFSSNIGDITLDFRELALDPNSELYNSEDLILKFKISEPKGDLLRILNKR